MVSGKYTTLSQNYMSETFSNSKLILRGGYYPGKYPKSILKVSRYYLETLTRWKVPLLLPLSEEYVPMC